MNKLRTTSHRLIRYLRTRLARTLPSRRAYQLWAATYPPYAHNALMEIEQDAMLRLLPDLTGQSVLDLACGSGRYGLIAQHRGAKLVIGVDDSREMLRVGVMAGVHFPLGEASMTALPFRDGAFQVILCGLALGHLSRSALYDALREMRRIVSADGTILFSDFHPALYAKGGRRSFTTSTGSVYHVEHHVHTIEEYRHIVEQVGLSITGIEEPHAQVRSDAPKVPAVLVIRCTPNSIS